MTFDVNLDASIGEKICEENASKKRKISIQTMNMNVFDHNFIYNSIVNNFDFAEEIVLGEEIRASAISTSNPEISNCQHDSFKKVTDNWLNETPILSFPSQEIFENSTNDSFIKSEVIVTIDGTTLNSIVLQDLKESTKFAENIEKAITSRLTTTQLDIQLLNWDFLDGTNRCLGAVAQLENLENLAFSSRLLHYECPKTPERQALFSEISDNDNAFESSDFWEIIRSCKLLKSLCITDDEFPTDRVIPENLLKIVSKCTNLQVLKLKNIPTIGKGVSLPFIFEGCANLKIVSIENVGNLQRYITLSSLEESVLYLKNCQELNLSLKLYLTKTLITNICQCKKLKLLSLKQMGMSKSEADDLRKFIPELPDLEKLTLKFIGRWHFFKSFNPVMLEMKANRSAFSFFLKNDVDEFRG